MFRTRLLAPVVLFAVVACGPESTIVDEAATSESGSQALSTLSASPSSLSLSAASTGQTQVTLSGSSKSAYTLTVQGLPTGLSASFSPASVTGSQTSTLTLSAASDAPSWSGTLTITAANCCGTSRTTTVAVTVGAGSGTGGGSGGGSGTGGGNAGGGAGGGTGGGTSTGGGAGGGSGSGGLGVISCPGRPGGRTQIDALIRVDQYKGVRSGSNGKHEILEGTILVNYGAISPGAVDTMNVELAMNVASSKDPSGLPQEVPLAVGATLEVVGEYIPASQANLTNLHGAAAVIHYTHSPCGEALINGTLYR